MLYSFFFFFKQKTAYEMRISDWSSDVCSSDLEVRLGDKLDIGFINEFLSEYGFERVDFVYEAGQFSIRGGIVDIFSFSHELPYRVEFFGNQVESIRSFDIESQLSERKLTRITVVPNIQSDILKQNKDRKSNRLNSSH